MSTVRFKFDPLDGLADRLERAAGRARYALAAVEAVNQVTTRASGTLQRGEIADINLTAAYVKSKTDLQLALPGAAPRATITTKGDPTVMGNFGVTMQSMVAGYGAIRRAGPRWGVRNAGTHVAIKRSAPVFEPQWFVLPLRGAGSTAGANGFGVFVRDSRLAPKNKRDGKAGKRHVYGPAPYQLFKHQVGVQSGAITDDLAKTALRLVGDELEDSLA